MVASTYISTNTVGGLCCSTLSTEFVVYGLFDDGHSDSCEVIPHCSFFFFFFKHLFVYLAAPGLRTMLEHAGIFHLALQHLGSLVAEYEVLIATCGILFHDQDCTWALGIGSSKS